MGHDAEWRGRVHGVAAWFALLGFGVLGWWLTLALWPASRARFHTTRSTESALLDFAWPGVPILGAGALAVAVARAPRSPWTQRAVWLMVGAVTYPALYALGATLATHGEGWAASMAMSLAAAGTALAAWAIRPDGPLFRVAPERTTARHVGRALAHTVVFWVTTLALAPWLVVQGEAAIGVPRFTTPGQAWLPGLLFAVAGLGNLHAGYVMSRFGRGTPLPLETARHLVIRGGYRWVRNPMAVSGLALGAAVGWWLGSWGTLAMVVAGGVLWHVMVRPIEERDLAARFGAPYAAYREAVRCWIPRWPPYPAAICPPAHDPDPQRGTHPPPSQV